MFGGKAWQRVSEYQVSDLKRTSTYSDKRDPKWCQINHNYGLFLIITVLCTVLGHQQLFLMTICIHFSLFVNKQPENIGKMYQVLNLAEL